MKKKHREFKIQWQFNCSLKAVKTKTQPKIELLMRKRKTKLPSQNAERKAKNKHK